MKKSKTPFFAISRIIAILFLFFLGLTTAQAQVKIGDNPNNIDPASVLELESASRALVLTRITDAQMQSMVPLQGAVIYNIDQQCVFYFDANSWKNLCAEGGGPGGDNATLVDNGDGTYTFTDSNGVETVILFNGGGNSVTGQPGSIFFAGTDMNASENNNELFWDTVTSRLGIGTNNNLNNKLTVNGDIGATQLLLNNANQDPTPLIIRGSGQDQRMIAFQDENLGTTLFNINFRGAGLNIDEINKSHRLFIKILGGMGIETRTPTETLDVAGTFRVRQLDPSQTTDNIVTVDANGVFHRSITTSSSGKSTTDIFAKKSAKWTNDNTKIGLNFGTTVAPIFASEEFKDDIYSVKGNSLVIKSSGRYEVRSNLSLLGANISSSGQVASINARININGLPKGFICVASNNGSKNSTVLSSLQINELLELNVGDVITIIVYTDALSNTIYFNGNNTSSFTITKFK